MKGIEKMKKRITAILLALTMIFAATGVAFADKTGADFFSGSPSGICVCGNGFLVTDVYNKIIWYMEGSNVAVIAGDPGYIDITGEYEGGYVDGSFGDAMFAEPWAIVPFKDGYAISDTKNNVVRYISGQSVQTLSRASYDRPTGLAVDDAGNLYIADTGSGRIFKITSQGTRSTYCLGLNEPMGLAWYNGTLYACETGCNRIVKVVKDDFTVVAGRKNGPDEFGDYDGGYVDGPVAKAEFDHPQGIVIDADGTMFISDTNNHAVRCIRDGRVYTIEACDDLSEGLAQPKNLAIKGNKVYVADSYSQTVFVYDTKYAGYSDVSAKQWYADAVKEATLRGIVGGVGGGKFSPKDLVSRAMFVTMLSRVNQNADRTEIISGDKSLDGISSGSWFEGSAKWAVSIGVIEGISGNFAPNVNVTREQAVTMLYRYARARGFDGKDLGRLASAFDDYAKAGSWAKDALDWAVSRGVIEGSGNSLNPKGEMTRAEAVKMFINFMEVCGL